MADHEYGIDVTELLHLADPNWEDPVHRRCIAASLVNVVYLLETNIRKADEWCSLLQFDVVETATDGRDNSIFAAVFQWRGRKKPGLAGGPPFEVVAFRGTLLRLKNIFEDLNLDLKVGTARLDSIRRVSIGLEYMRRSIQTHGHGIWIAGHSLGAAIALAAARKMEREERHQVEAHLFNPPFASPRLPELIFFEKIAKLLSAVRNGGSPCYQLPHLEGIYKRIQGASEPSALRMGLKDDKKLMELYGNFVGVSSWIPHLYVNDKDPICCTYLPYFETWKGVYGGQKSNHLVYESLKYLFCFEVAKKRTPWHLIPSAKLVVAVRHLFHNHHSLRQWWSKDLPTHIKEYIPPLEVTHWINTYTIKSCTAFDSTAEAEGDDREDRERA